MRPSYFFCLIPCFLLPQLKADWPQTIPEATQFHRTSTVAEVQTFMQTLVRKQSGLKLYRPQGAPRSTETGKALLAWKLKATGPNPLRVLINGNIHAGEVEGKEAIQMLARELLQGRHPELRKSIELVLIPAYNADGTDTLNPAIRAYQPNPESGVGRRENAFGLDLNRDFMRIQASNTRFFLALMRDFDPHALLDLHTTNGSVHGFHLTYSPSQALGADTKLTELNRRMLKEIREKLAQEGMPTYDYGNFSPYRPSLENPPVAWEGFDPLPRYLTNYPGLRNRLAVLSEAFAYRSYSERIQDTRRFVLACLTWLSRQSQEVREAEKQAEKTWVQAWREGKPPLLPLHHEATEREKAEFTWILPIRDAQRRIIGEEGRRTLLLPVLLGMKPKDLVEPPLGYLIDPAYRERIQPLLDAHGIQWRPGSQRPKDKGLLHFHESGRDIAKEAFQGIFWLSLKGEWKAQPPMQPLVLPWSQEDLDRGLWIPLYQPLGRLAFYLLDPRSPDGWVWWGCFHASLLRGPGMWGEPPRFPILALEK